MEKNTITKWLLMKNDNNEVEIEEREVSKFAPINRYLDKAGWYQFEFIDVNYQKYCIVTLIEEENMSKNKMLVSRWDINESKFVDMSKVDQENTFKIIEQYMI